MIRFIKRNVQNLMSDKRFSEILSGSIWALSARVIATMLGIITSVIIARFYGAEVMGTVALLNSFFILATMFTLLGTKISILRLIPEHIAKYSPASAFKVYRKTQYFVAGLSLLTGSFLFFGSEFISGVFFSKPHLAFYFALSAGFVIFNSLGELNTSAIRGMRLIKLFAFMQLLPSVSKIIILVPVTIFLYHRYNPIYAIFGSMAVTAVVGALIMDRTFRLEISPNDVIRPMSIKEILAISLPMLMTATMTFIIAQTGIIILGMLRPETEVGYYSIAVRLATLTTFVLSAVNTMAAPKFSELFHSNKMDDLFYIAQKSSKLIFWTTTPLLIILVLFGKLLISLLYGSDFVIAFLPMIFLVAGQFVNSISGSTGFFLNMTGHQNIFRNIMFFSALINVVLNLLLIPGYGLYGAAVSAMITNMAWNISALITIKKKFGRTTGYFPFISTSKI
jgi:O-antigen/teichoic acid export membrane protein